MSVQVGADGLVGRSSDIQMIAASILDPLVRGAWVCGPAGIGKSVVASSVLNGLAGKVVALTVHADSSLECVSYGALAPLLQDPTEVDLTSYRSVLRLIRAAIHSISFEAGLPVLVTVHSAHHLDRQSSHLLGELALAGEIRLLVLPQGMGCVPEELHSLCRDGLLVRFELPALSRENVAVLSQQELGGIVSSRVVSFISDWSQGNPSIVRALIAHLVTSGSLVERNGVWLMLSVPQSVGDELLDRAKTLLLGCSPDNRRAIEMVALLGCIPAAAARHLLDAGAMEQGLKLDVLSYSEHHGGRKSCVTVEPGVYGEAIRQLVPPGRRAEILSTLRDSVSGREVLQAAGVSRRVGWAMDLGHGIPDRELLEAAIQANLGFASTQAQRFSAAVTSPEFTTAARVETAKSFLDLADIDSAASEIRGLIEEAADPRTLADAAITDAQIALQLGGGARDLMTVADRWVGAGKRLPANVGHLDKPVEQGAAILRHVSLGLAGRYDAAIGGLRAVTGNTHPESIAGVTSRMLLGEALGATGKTSEAKDLTLGAVAATQGGGLLSRFYRAAATRHGALLVQVGDEKGLARLRLAYEDSATRQPQHFGGNMMTLHGLMDFRCGRIDSSCELLAAGIEELRRHDPELLLPLAVGTAAFASRLVGATDRALGYLQDYRGLRYRGFLPQGLVADAYISAARSWPAVSADDLLALRTRADHARDFGLVHAEAEILELLFFLKEPLKRERLEELAGLLGAVDSDAIPIMAKVAESPEAALLVSAGNHALSGGKFLLGAECLARGAAEYGLLGDKRAQRAALQQLRGLAPLLGRARTGAITDDSLARVALTQRELEIASLAVRGASSNEIASRLTVSRRTVEGHLYRIYIKLGINGREDLVAGLVETVSEPLDDFA